MGDYGLLVLNGSRFQLPGELARARVATNAVPMSRRLFAQSFPEADHVYSATYDSALETLCQGQVEAVFGSVTSLYAAALRESACPGQGLRMLPIPCVHTELGVASTKAMAVVADEIRSTFGAMIDDGTAVRIAGRFPGMPAQVQTSLREMQRTSTRLWRYPGLQHGHRRPAAAGARVYLRLPPGRTARAAGARGPGTG